MIDGVKNIAVDKTGTVKGFEQLLDSILGHKPESLFILACEGNGLTSEQLNPILKQMKIPIFGGIFPSIIYNRENINQGTIVIGLARRPVVQIIPNLDLHISSSYVIDKNLITENTKTMFVLLDGCSMRATNLLDSIFDMFGSELNYLGGGAGSITTLKPSPCLFSNEGLIQNGALLITMDNPSAIGTTHGLKSISGPHVITKSRENIVETIDLKPIYHFFQEIRKSLLLPGQNDNFPLVSRYFSFGLQRSGTENIIREPAQILDDSSMVFGTNMIERELIHIMRADEEGIFLSLRQTIEQIKPPRMSKGMFVVFDCISRKWFFEDRYNELLDILYYDNFPTIGAQTIGGEIGCNIDNHIEYLNRTCAVGYIES
ncbi:MAG: FIST C-terminal domain-containing protein [Oligoflexia bacterium]|nr:FIST C-terminal domain-containing protein [Oligoflexia bacterium]